MDFYTTDKPDGTKARRVVADGNVVFMKDEERLSGSHLDMDLDTGKGVMDDAIGYMVQRGHARHDAEQESNHVLHWVKRCADQPDRNFSFNRRIPASQRS